mmetsp:Transcript_3618/g.11159  ORF Transcript_3618/g.11159 Transcript_3618/m.11159 type:complete len:208 (+) Transcript_3618:838-1461(+)
MRRDGSYCSILDSRSMPSSSRLGAMLCSATGSYLGQSALYSGKSIIDGHVSSVGVPRTLKMRTTWSWSDVPGKSGRPEAISPKMHPTLHRSTGVEYLRDPISTSGARYQSVTTSCVYDRTGMPKALASPKSASLSSPCLLMSRFCGLRSRCSTRRSWQNATPFSNCSRARLIILASAPSGQESRYFLRSWSRYSKTSVSFFSVWMTS